MAAKVKSRLVWRPTSKQEEFLNAGEDEVLYGGAAGGGKSEALLMFSVLRRLRLPKTRGLILRRTYFMFGSVTIVAG